MSVSSWQDKAVVAIGIILWLIVIFYYNKLL